MPALWHSWKKSLTACKSTEDGEALPPSSSSFTKSPASTCSSTTSSLPNNTAHTGQSSRRSGCSRSFSNLKDVINRTNTTTNTNITANTSINSNNNKNNDNDNNYIGEYKIKGSISNRKSSWPGSPASVQSSDFFHSDYEDHLVSLREKYLFISKTGPPASCATQQTGGFRRRLGSVSCYDCSLVQNPSSLPFVRYRGGASSIAAAISSIISQPVCSKCGEILPSQDALDNHHLSSHSIVDLKTGESSRNVVEIIFRTSWFKPELLHGGLKIERVLKVHNLQKTLSVFEEYRDYVKAKAGNLPAKKHPRCLADGNELLRFYATTLMCPLLTGVCTSRGCHVCGIIRRGFGHVAAVQKAGIATCATSGGAHERVKLTGKISAGKRAMLLCRVIAGRVHKSPESSAILNANNRSVLPDENGISVPPAGFDSVADQAGPYSKIEELRVFNTGAILPCFLVIYQCS